MKVYQVDTQWYAAAAGGFRNRDEIPETVVGPFNARPEPLLRWKTTESNRAGHGRCVHTQFAVNGAPVFVLRDYYWSPSCGYSWDESWEDIVPVEEAPPPELGECFRWTGDGWETSRHPMSVE